VEPFSAFVASDHVGDSIVAFSADAIMFVRVLLSQDRLLGENLCDGLDWVSAGSLKRSGGFALRRFFLVIWGSFTLLHRKFGVEGIAVLEFAVDFLLTSRETFGSVFMGGFFIFWKREFWLYNIKKWKFEGYF
jgi:hypothetical protein